MNSLSIGIIGGTGGIGKWFADFFAQEGYAVHVSGRKRGPSFTELAVLCRVVIVAVPIAATIETIEKVGPYLSPDSVLMDLTSIKEEPIKVMLAATRAEVVGCHPLFGPDARSVKDNNIIFCHARGERWLSFMTGLFAARGAHVTTAEPDEHDRMMALIQGVTHLNTMLLELALRDSGIEPSRLEPFSTPIFRTKKSIGEKLGPNADLYAAILTKNAHVARIIEKYEKDLSLIKSFIVGKDASGLAELLRWRGR